MEPEKRVNPTESSTRRGPKPYRLWTISPWTCKADFLTRPETNDTMARLKQLLTNKTILALLALAIILSAMLVLADGTIASRFNYKIF